MLITMVLVIVIISVGLMCTLYYLDTYQVEYIKMYKYKLEYKGMI